MELTKEQIKALETIKERWATVTAPVPFLGGDGCAMVQVTGENGGSMWLGIETDGYTHS